MPLCRLQQEQRQHRRDAQQLICPGTDHVTAFRGLSTTADTGAADVYAELRWPTIQQHPNGQQQVPIRDHYIGVSRELFGQSYAQGTSKGP